MVDSLPDEFIAAVRACLPRLAALIASGPAAELGRLGAPDDPAPARPAGPSPAAPGRGGQLRLAQARVAHRLGASAAEPVPLTVLRDLGPLLPERLLGALEVTIAGLELPALPA